MSQTLAQRLDDLPTHVADREPVSTNTPSVDPTPIRLQIPSSIVLTASALTFLPALLFARTCSIRDSTPAKTNIIEKSTPVVSRCFSTNEELRTAQDAETVEVLDLGDSSITDAGLVHLKRFESLRRLELCNSRVTDSGIFHLQHCQKPEELWLTGFRISNSIVASLRKLSNLKDIQLWGTNLTRNGVSSLQSSLPGISVEGPDSAE